MHKRRFLLSLSIIAICTFVVSALVSAQSYRPPRPDIGGGNNSQTAAAVIIKCAPGARQQVQDGETESQTGNCSCTQSSSGSSSCTCSTNTQGSNPPASNASGLLVEEIYASADFPAGKLDEIASAGSCADAVLLLQSGSDPRSGGGACQFAVGSYPWYSCEL